MSTRRKRWTEEEKRRIFDKHQGRCGLCGEHISFGSYGLRTKGGWHVDHAKALARGGHATHLNNLQPAHWDCNIAKSTQASTKARAVYGLSRAPLTSKQEAAARAAGAATGVTVGAVLGALGGPFTALVGAVAGAAIGGSLNPEPRVAPAKRLCDAVTKAGYRCQLLARNGARCHVHGG